MCGGGEVVPPTGPLGGAGSPGAQFGCPGGGRGSPGGGWVFYTGVGLHPDYTVV